MLSLSSMKFQAWLNPVKKLINVFCPIYCRRCCQPVKAKQLASFMA
jgi:hypothetical protein